MALAGPRGEHQQQARVLGRGDLVALGRVEDGEQPGAAGDRLAAGLRDLDPPGDDQRARRARGPGARRDARRRGAGARSPVPRRRRRAPSGDAGRPRARRSASSPSTAAYPHRRHGDRDRRPGGGRQVNRRPGRRRGARVHLPRLRRDVSQRRARGAARAGIEPADAEAVERAGPRPRHPPRRLRGPARGRGRQRGDPDAGGDRGGLASSPSTPACGRRWSSASGS